MLIGTPDHKPPIEQGLRCNRRTYYAVFVGAGQFDESLYAAARERANQMHTHSVDAREMPWINCLGCGGVLDFSMR